MKIRNRASIFDSPESQSEALTALKAFMSSDGISPEESAFLDLLTTHFP
jgi:hypothetical protein